MTFDADAQTENDLPDEDVFRMWQEASSVQFYTSTGSRSALCPDLLSIRDIGEADGWRGRLVRAFFHLLRAVTGV